MRRNATEIVEFEGPIHLDRLAQLTAASFGGQRLWPVREKKLIYQIRQIGLMVDGDKFVGPSDLDPKTWSEFRPPRQHHLPALHADQPDRDRPTPCVC